MAKQYQLSSTPGATDYPFLNLTGADLPAGVAVVIDTTQTLGNDGVDGIPIALPGAAGVPIVGITVDIIPAGQSGTVRCAGPICITRCEGNVSPGGLVTASATVGKLGWCKAISAGQAQVGMSLDGGVDGDDMLVMFVPAKNA